MKIGIVGAGNIGGNLARRLVELGHKVHIANSRGPQSLAGLARATGAVAVATAEVANEAEVVILAVREGDIASLPAGFLDGARPGTPVVDTGNYYPERDGRIQAIEAGAVQSRWVSQQVGRPVVKAFNTFPAHYLLDRGRATGDPERIAVPVAGDEPGPKASVMGLVDQLGFDPVDAGTVDESWRQQPGTPAYAVGLDARGMVEALHLALPRRPDVMGR